MARREPLKIGKPHTDPESPAHVPGVREGNSKGRYRTMPGHTPDGRSSARRSTGIDPDSKDPIRSDMPKLTPA